MSYVRLKLFDAEEYEYFDTAKDFAQRYRALIANKNKISDVQTIIANFCHSQNDYGIKELLKQGEPLQEGYLIIQESDGCSPYYHTGTGYTRDKIRARIFSEQETNKIVKENVHRHLKKEYISL